MWLTLFWHVGTGLPWVWRIGPSDSSERQHLAEMLPELPKNTPIAADASVKGHDVWNAVLTAEHCFVIRSGANVRLGNARREGYRLKAKLLPRHRAYGRFAPGRVLLPSCA